MRGEAASAAQGGDIFAAKYVLKPIYDTVHLNFLILCFLGEDSRDIAARALGDCCRRATLIHLDSLRRAKKRIGTDPGDNLHKIKKGAWTNVQV